MFDDCLTNSLKLRAEEHLTVTNMDEENVINIREFLRNYKKFKTKTHIIANHGKPEVVVIPYKEWQAQQAPKLRKNSKNELKRISLAEAIKPYVFEGGDPHLSQKVDEIVYGTSNSHRKDDNS